MLSRSTTRVLLCSSFLAASSGCGGAAGSRLGRNADENYHHPEYGYGLLEAPESPAVLLGGGWHADSLALAAGPVSGSDSNAKLTQHYDWNDDGETDHTEEMNRYELHLVHDNGAEVFIRAVPVPASLEGKRPSELALAYMQAITRDGDMAARFSPADLPTKSGNKIEAGLIGEGSCSVSGVEAYRLELTAQRTEPAPPGPQKRARLIIVRPGYHHKVVGAEDRKVPVMLVAAYTNLPEKFDEQEEDFNRFLGQWVLGGYGEAIPVETGGGAHTCEP